MSIGWIEEGSSHSYSSVVLMFSCSLNGIDFSSLRLEMVGVLERDFGWDGWLTPILRCHPVGWRLDVITGAGRLPYSQWLQWDPGRRACRQESPGCRLANSALGT